MAEPSVGRPSGESRAFDRLDSWKEIATYLRRGERTVRRWEQTEGLPVHRHTHQKQATVYALRSELDLWLEQRGNSLEPPEPEPAKPQPRPDRKDHRRALGIAAVITVAAAVLVLVFWKPLLRTPTGPRPQSAVTELSRPPEATPSRELAPPAAAPPVAESKGAPAPPRSAGVTSDPVFRSRPITTFPGSEHNPSFSPDGQMLAFSWARENGGTSDIYTMRVNDPNPRQLTTHPADDGFPAWSPDGKWIAFLRWQPRTPTEVLVVPATSGPERVVSTIWTNTRGQFTASGTLVAWSPDGRWLAVPDRPSPQEPSGLFLLSVASGEKRRLTTGSHFAPAFSPDGRYLAYVQTGGPGFSLWMLPLDQGYKTGGNARRLTFEGFASSPAWSRNGRAILYAGGELMGTRAIYELEVLPEPEKGTKGKPLPLEINDATIFTVSFADPRGMQLVYEKLYFDPNIWALELADDGKPAVPARPVSHSTRVDFFPHLSPDGKSFTFTSTRSGHQEIWTAKRDGTEVRQLTFMEATAGVSRWSPDGRWIVFIAGQPRVGNYVVSADGGEPRLIHDGQIASWSADSKSIYFLWSDKRGPGQIWKVSIAEPAGGVPREPSQITTNGGNAAFESPDGKSVYVFNKGIWKVNPVEHSEERLPIEFAEWNSWAVVREGIVFISNREPATIDYYRFATRATTTIASIQKPVLAGLSASADGKVILYTQVDRDESDLMLAVNARF